MPNRLSPEIAANNVKHRHSFVSVFFISHLEHSLLMEVIHMMIHNTEPSFPTVLVKENKRKEIEQALYQVFSKYFEKRA